MKGKLYIIGTPIGNLEDITLRALRVLKEADFVVAEDTRVSKKLLSHYDINKPLLSYIGDDRQDRIEKIIKLLKEGNNIAFVSDAGTPGISDPCHALVKAVYEENSNLEAGLPSGMKIEVVAIPGPSALVSAISISGLDITDFLFLGFLPHKKGRETLFKEIAEAKRAVIFYESPHRIIKSLESLAKFAPQKEIAIARELTKIHEEIIRGKASEVLDFFTKNKEKVRGEFVVIVAD